MSAMAQLVSALDDAIAAQQDVIRQLVRAKAEIVRLYDHADIETGRAPSLDPDIWMTDTDINDTRAES